MSELFCWRGNGPGDKSNPKDGRNYATPAGTQYPVERFPGSLAGVFDEVILDQALGNGLPPTGADFTAQETWKRLTISQAYNGTVASAATRLKAEVAELYVNAPNSEEINLELLEVDKNKFNHPTITVRDCSDLKLKGAICGMNAMRGGITIIQGSDFDQLYPSNIGFRETPEADVVMTIEKDCTHLNLEVTGGIVDCSSRGSVRLSNGSWKHRTGDFSLVQYGGTCEWYGGNILSAYLNGGVLDGSPGQEARHIIYAKIFSGAEVNLDNGLGNIRVLQLIDVEGGSFQASPGQDVRFSGIYSEIEGLAPQTMTSAATVQTPWIYLLPYDHLQFLSILEDPSTFITLWAAKDDAGTEAEEINPQDFNSETGHVASYSGTRTVWGWQLPDDKPYVSCKLETISPDPVIASVLPIKRSY